MKKTLILILIFSCFCKVFSQKHEKAIETSKEILKLIVDNQSEKLLNKFEEDNKKYINISMIEEYVQKFNISLKNQVVDFEDFIFQINVPIEEDNFSVFKSTFEYKFPFKSSEDKKDFLQVFFYKDSDFERIIGVNVIKIERFPDVKVTYGAEFESIPKQGEVITEVNDFTGLITKIKYRDFEFLYIIEFDEKQRKTSENKYPISDLKYKTITKFNENGNIILMASYKNGIVVDLFKSFYENGSLKEKGIYNSEHQKEGKWEYFDEKGSKIREVNYIKGKIVK